MTVKEILTVIPLTRYDVNIISTVHEEYYINPRDYIMREAFRDFVVAELEFKDTSTVNIIIKTVPLKENNAR